MILWEATYGVMGNHMVHQTQVAHICIKEIKIKCICWKFKYRPILICSSRNRSSLYTYTLKMNIKKWQCPQQLLSIKTMTLNSSQQHGVLFLKIKFLIVLPHWNHQLNGQCLKNYLKKLLKYIKIYQSKRNCI